MLDADFVCCCIPLVNVGLYFILLEQLTVALVAGVATIGTSSAVGVLALPPFTGWLFAGLCFLVGAGQLVGLVGVVQERPALFRSYALLNTVAVLGALACGAALTVVAGLKHSQSSRACQTKFYGNATSSPAASVGGTSLSLADSADEICDIFVTVDASLMGGIWLLLAIVQIYLLFVIRLYGREQKADHGRYMSMYSTKGGFADEDIPLGHPASDPWSTGSHRRSLSTDFPSSASATHANANAKAARAFGRPTGAEDEDDEGSYYYAAPPLAGGSGGGYPPVPQGTYDERPMVYDDGHHHHHHGSDQLQQSQHPLQQQQQQHFALPPSSSSSYEPGQPFPLHEQQAYVQQQQQQQQQGRF